MKDSQTPASELTVDQKRSLLKKLLCEKLEDVAHPLSYGQRALWFLQCMAPDSAAYNVAISGCVEPPLDLARFEGAVAEVVHRHEPLHTVVVDGVQPSAKSLPGQSMPRVYDVSELSEAEVLRLVGEDYRRPFQLEQSGPVRVSVYRCCGRDVILINVHHIALDAWSAQIFIEELQAVYEGATLPLLRSSYREFVDWQRAMLNGPEGERLGKFWEAQLSGELPVLNLRPAHQRPERPTFHGGTVALCIEAEMLDDLRELARRHRTTLFTLLLLAWAMLLADESGQDEVVIGTPVSGRTRPEWSPLIGFFVNMLPLRIRIDRSQGFDEQIPAVFETVRQALAHQDYPFSLMVDRVRAQRFGSESPLFQAMLNVVRIRPDSGVATLLGTDEHASIPFGDSGLKNYPVPQQLGQFDWALEFAETDSRLSGQLKYSFDAGTAEQATQLADRFRSLVAHIVSGTEEREDVSIG